MNINKNTARTRQRVTKEIAQQRVYNMGRNYTIIEWNGTSKQAKVRCNKCGRAYTFKNGSSLYAIEYYRYGLSNICYNCEHLKNMKYTNHNATIGLEEWECVLNNIPKIKSTLKEYVGKEVKKSEVTNVINERLGVALRWEDVFGRIVGRLCEYKTLEHSSPQIHIITEVYGDKNMEYQEKYIRANVDGCKKAIDRNKKIKELYNDFIEGKILWYEINKEANEVLLEEVK